uniref:Fibronectin type-III domain-containing protein n=1 Tax=Pundamilia nyererei TaxID=303518 RepID=A0A3B4FJ60_9CICH
MASLLPTKTHFHIVVTDSGWLLKAQEFTVPGNQSHLDIGGLITGIGYEVRLTGVSESGLLSRPLTAVAVTGTTQSHLFTDIYGQNPIIAPCCSLVRLVCRSGSNSLDGYEPLNRK